MSNFDIVTRRRLASDLVSKAIQPKPNGWHETRAVLVSNATGQTVAVLPPQGWTMAGAQELVSLLNLTLKVVTVTVTLDSED